jgi:hypothetical protein
VPCSSNSAAVKVPQFMGLERYSHVMHLVSVGEGRLAKECDRLDALVACFPAGTVSGAPKIRAMEIIAELEPDRRGSYAGAVGYLDFRGNMDSVRTVVEARPDYFNHNVETVPRLYDFVRPGSRFQRSLDVLRAAKQIDPAMTTKSGLMLGLGERRDEVIDVLQKLRDAGVEIVTIGQYLQPKREKLDVVEYVHPTVFDEYRRLGDGMGFAAVFSGPFVRSSYMADVVASAAAHA